MLLLASYWFTVSLLLALIEIEIEGKYGWSEKTQTWRLPPSRQPKVIAWIMRGKVLTGYHLFLFPLAFIFTHSPLFYTRSFSVVQELQILAIYFAWTPLWDYLWFVWNPHYGVLKIVSSEWYKNEKFILRLFPFSIIAQWGASILFALSTMFITHTNYYFINHLIFMIYLGLFSLVSSFLVPFYRRWYIYMRKNSSIL